MTDPHPDQLVRWLSSDGAVAVRTVVGTRLVRSGCERHGTGPVASVALGRTLLGALLLASGGKDGETVQVRVQGRGALRRVVAEADCEGNARGWVSEPDVPLPADAARLSIAGAIGLGELVVVRHRPGWREPYTGIVPLVSGEIGEDLALYLTESEQTPSAVGVGVHLARDATVDAAAGFVAVALPGADEAAVARLEANVRALPSPTAAVREGASAADLAALLLAGLEGRELDRGPVRFHCRCDAERVLRAVALLGEREIDELVAAGEPIEVRCVYCSEPYRVDPERVRARLAGEPDRAS